MVEAGSLTPQVAQQPPRCPSLQVPEVWFWKTPLGQDFLSKVSSLPPQSHSFHHHLFRDRMGTTTVEQFRTLRSNINETPVSAVGYQWVSHMEVPKAKPLYHQALRKYLCSSKRANPGAFAQSRLWLRFPGWALGGKASWKREFHVSPVPFGRSCGRLGCFSNAAKNKEFANLIAESPAGTRVNLYSCPTSRLRYLCTNVQSCFLRSCSSADRLWP